MKNLKTFIPILFLFLTFRLNVMGQIMPPTFTEPQLIGGHGAVDLGLPSGTLWASQNLGAKNPADFGEYFNWGHIVPSRSFDRNSCNTIGVKIEEFAMNQKYDAATVRWGSDWYTPTRDQAAELLLYCKFERVEYKGSYGFKVTGPNGNSIFVPMPGFKYDDKTQGDNDVGFYWTSTPGHATTGLDIREQMRDRSDLARKYAKELATGEMTFNDILPKFNITAKTDDMAEVWGLESEGYSALNSMQRDLGLPIRAVTGGKKHISRWKGPENFTRVSYGGHVYADLGLPSGTLWAINNVGASFLDDPGDYYLYKFEASKPKDDPAQINWGGAWRSPSSDEMKELFFLCEWVPIGEGERIKGMAAVGPNGNYLYFPLGGIKHKNFHEGEGLIGQIWSREVDPAAKMRWGTQYSPTGAALSHLRDIDEVPVRPVSIFRNKLTIRGKGEAPASDTQQSRTEKSSRQPFSRPESKTDAVHPSDILEEFQTETDDIKDKKYFKHISDYWVDEMPESNYSMPEIIQDIKAQIENPYSLESDSVTPDPCCTKKCNPCNCGNNCKCNVPRRSSKSDFIDLGLPSGTLWGNRNLGADKPSEPGLFYAWGELTPAPDGNYIEAYCRLYELRPDSIVWVKEYDAARADWGDDACMPTKRQFEELINNCKWEWTTMEGQEGKMGTGPNGRTIFFPAAGWFWAKEPATSIGEYWTGEIDKESEGRLPFAAELDFLFENIVGMDPAYGLSIRPVKKK